MAVITLPVIAPAGGTGVGADRYPLYRNTDEVGQPITVVGYGTVGTGTTGETPNTNNTKGIVQNRYDGVGERLGFAAGTSLLYDFDNGSPANDAFGRVFGVNDLGVTGEGTGSAGDSGGPVFVTVGGVKYIAGTTTSGPTETNPENPAVVNRGVQSGYGSISHDMRVSSFAPWIDVQTGKGGAVTLDLRFQPAGLDAAPDAITVRANGTDLELVVNGTLFQSVPLSQITSLKLTGAGDAGTPFSTTAVLQNGVAQALPVTYERILSVTDNRTPTPTTTAPPAPAAPVPTPPAPPTSVETRPAPVVSLESVPNLVSPSTLLAAGGPNGTLRVLDTRKGNAVAKDFQPFAGFTGPVSGAFGDVTGDLVKDLAVAAGKGGGPRVTVFDGKTGAVVRDFFAYDQGFTGGVSVALADVNGDGTDDIVTAAGAGGGRTCGCSTARRAR